METITVEARDDGRVELQAGHREKENIKEIPGARWDQHARTWTVPASWAALQQLRGVFGDRLAIGERLTRMSWEVYEGRVKPALELRQAHDAPWIKSDKLTPLQKAGVAFMIAAGCAVESDPMGAGKTPITIKTLEEMPDDPFPCCVISPNGVKPHWRNEFATWWPEAGDVAVVQGNVKRRREAMDAVASGNASVLAINWEVLTKHSRVAGFGDIALSDKEKEEKELNHIPFTTVIADEAHRAKDPRAKQTRALWKIGDGATHRYALTGTPIANSPDDLWAVMRFVYPAEYPAKGAFVDRYANMVMSAFGYVTITGLRGDTRDELFRFLDPRLIRRPKALILPQLAGKTPPQRRLVDLVPKQKKAYEALRKDMIVQLDGGVLMTTEPLQHFLRLRQFAAATAEITEDGKVRLTEPSSKLDELETVLEELGIGTGGTDNDKAVVFAESQQLIELASLRLAKRGIDAVMYTGAQSEDERERNRAAFQDNPHVRVILCTYGAGAEGVNLSSGTANIKLERAQSLVKDKQADDRTDRPSPHEWANVPTRMIEVFANGTVDWDVEANMAQKDEMFEEIVRDEKTLRAMLETKPL